MERKYQLDSDTLECPICREPLSPPVHQCCNGHIACAACCEKLIGRECPYCREKPIAHSRCFAIEKIVESLVMSCQYAVQGCNEMVKFTKREEHEKELCEYRPIQCPVLGCKYKGLMLAVPVHFGSHIHRVEIVQLDPLSRTVKFTMTRLTEPYVLVEGDEGLLLVHRCRKKWDINGDMFFCTSFGSSSKTYNLKVKLSGGSSFFVMETLALDNQGKEETWQKSEFLLVPNLNGSLNRHFDVELRVL